MDIRVAETVFPVFFVCQRMILSYSLALRKELEDFIYGCMLGDGMVIGRVEHQQIHDSIHRTT